MRSQRQNMQRDRPLQNSMILPDTNNNLNKRPSAPMEYFPIPNIKKMANYMSTQSHFQQQHHNLVMQPTQQRQQFQQVNVQQDNNYVQRSNDSMLHEIYEKMDKLARTVEKHQFQLGSLTVEGQFSKRVMNQVKKNLPVFTGGNDVYEHIFNLKLDIKNIQQELSKTPKVADLDIAIKKQVQNIQKKTQNSTSSNSSLSGSNVGKQNEIDPLLKQLLRGRDQYFQNILSNLQTQISIVKKNISTLNIQMKVSPIVSNSCIMLKYQQLFKGRTKLQSDMVLSQNTYYIDNEGYLLDCHSRYIVDQKGKKIKLQEKHIALLKNQKILQ